MKKNNKIKIHSIGTKAEPSKKQQIAAAELFNKLLNRPDYKVFNYGRQEVKAPYKQALNFGENDTQATYIDVTKTELHHIKMSPCGRDSTMTKVMVREIRKYKGETVGTSYGFAGSITSYDAIPQPEVKDNAETERLSEERVKRANIKTMALASNEVEQERLHAELYYMYGYTLHELSSLSLSDMKATLKRLNG